MQQVDIVILVGYLVLALVVGLWQRKKAQQSAQQFFLAGRSLPWWLAGTSIAATTFAADTPLAITGIIAAKGISGNWLWLAWVGVHCGVVVFFARYWSAAGTLTDAELYSLRYDGKSAEFLRSFRSLLSGLVINTIVLGWVIKAMVKICSYLIPWEQWHPNFFTWAASYWPAGLPIGGLSEAITVIGLIVLVAIYSSLGGIRGVIVTDLIQFAIALVGGIWLAAEVLGEIGGFSQFAVKLGEAEAWRLQLFPTESMDWVSSLEFSGGLFALYLFVQSLSNNNSDGGGYIMQRLNTTRSQEDAQKASLLFVFFHYLVRIWPWFVVALGALILIPLGQESSVFGGAAVAVGDDRELAYPFLMTQLLQPGVLGLVFASLVAAFMSTIDTHINWGASYFVNDWYMRFYPSTSPRKQVLVGRAGVFLFMTLAIVISFYIDSVEQGWKWVATIGASFGVPSLLRWFWWRLTATCEILAVSLGLSTAVICELGFSMVYEWKLVAVFVASVSGVLLGVLFSRPVAVDHLSKFYKQVRPLGIWPGAARGKALSDLALAVSVWLSLVATVVSLLSLGVSGIFAQDWGSFAGAMFVAIVAGAYSFIMLPRIQSDARQ